jgi:ATP-dependent protease ClpP protease subunit
MTTRPRRLAARLAIVRMRAAVAACKAAPAAEESVVIEIHGEIGREVSKTQILSQIRAARGRPLRVLIDSVGGAVGEGMPIYEALAMHDGPVETHARMAQSMAALIFLAGRERNIERGGEILLHEVYVQSGAKLHAGSVHTIAKSMEKTHRDCVRIVAKAAKVTKGHAERWLDKDGRSFSAEQAVAAGLAHRIVPRSELRVAGRRITRSSSSRPDPNVMAAALVNTKRFAATADFRWGAEQARRAAKLKLRRAGP